MNALTRLLMVFAGVGVLMPLSACAAPGPQTVPPSSASEATVRNQLPADADRDSFSLVLLAAPKQDAEVAVVETAAQARGAHTRVVRIDPADPVPAFIHATSSAPDVVMTIGPRFLTTLDPISAANLAQPFLVLGAQLPEPTANVTAMTWPGADTRFFEGSTDSLDLDQLAHAADTGLARILPSDG